MAILVLKTHAEQVADYLRNELKRGRWSGWMPGVLKLEKELGVNRNTLEAGLKILEAEGALVTQGIGKRRQIAPPKADHKRLLKFGILSHEPLDREWNFITGLIHRLKESGHQPFLSQKSIQELNQDLPRIVRMLEQNQADAWMVIAGPRNLLEHLADTDIPTYAIFGRRSELPISGTGPDKAHAIRELVQRLVDLGHKRIVLLNHRMRRHPHPGRIEREFLAALESHGLPTGPYNMPDWKETPQGFHDCLRRLFQHTPPTALIADEAILFMAAMQFCAYQSLHVPQDVSLVCTDSNPAFTYFDPQVTHIAWEAEPVVTNAVKWANELACGRDKRKQSYTKATLIEGGTIGRVKAGV